MVSNVVLCVFKNPVYYYDNISFKNKHDNIHQRAKVQPIGSLDRLEQK